jgi:hypothetical protein
LCNIPKYYSGCSKNSPIPWNTDPKATTIKIYQKGLAIVSFALMNGVKKNTAIKKTRSIHQ